MSVDLSRAESFLAGNGRLLDRRRFELLLGRTGPDAVLAALEGYRNDDGGYGWGLEPDLRARRVNRAERYTPSRYSKRSPQRPHRVRSNCVTGWSR